jgi:hypothetical protein
MLRCLERNLPSLIVFQGQLVDVKNFEVFLGFTRNFYSRHDLHIVNVHSVDLVLLKQLSVLSMSSSEMVAPVLSNSKSSSARHFNVL